MEGEILLLPYKKPVLIVYCCLYVWSVSLISELAFL